MDRFFQIREDIEGKKANPENRLNVEIGLQRESLVIEALEELKELKIIKDFIPPGNLSYADIKRGIDVFVIRIGAERYNVIPLSITGEAWEERHREAHPDVPVITVNYKESKTEIEDKIRAVIQKYQ